MINKLKHLITALFRPHIKGTFEYLKKNKMEIINTYKNKGVLKDTIISMTTYEPRVKFFEYSILSILAGSVLPENVFVYVPKGFKDLLNNSGSFLNEVYDTKYVQIIEMEVDYYCHSKYYYVFKEFGDHKNIVLCDDDVVYYDNWLKQLSRYTIEKPGFDVYAYMAIDVPVQDNEILPYDAWTRCSSEINSNGKQLYTEAVGGVWYKKGLFKREVFNKEVFLKIAEKADDVWLWYCVCLNGGIVSYVPTLNNSKLQYIIPFSQEFALWKENTFGKRNDTYVVKCREYFKNTYNIDIVDYLTNRNNDY